MSALAKLAAAVTEAEREIAELEPTVATLAAETERVIARAAADELAELNWLSADLAVPRGTGADPGTYLAQALGHARRSRRLGGAIAGTPGFARKR